MAQAQTPDWWQPQEKVSQALTTQQDVDAFDSMLKSGNYQGAYNLGKARGFDDQTLAAYADSKDGGAWRTATTQPGKTLDQGVANTFANTAQNFDTLNSVVPSARHNASGNMGMDSDAFRKLAGSTTSQEGYWQGMAGLIGAGARANDANTNSVNPGDNLTLTQDALNRMARAQYAGSRTSLADMQKDEHYRGLGSDAHLTNYGLEKLTGLNNDQANALGLNGIDRKWLASRLSAEQLATAADPAAYLRQLANQYYSTPESSAMAARSPENEAQWQAMLAKSRSIKDPNSGMYLTLMPNGNYALLNEYGTGRGVYAPNSGIGWNQSGIDQSLFDQLKAGGGTNQQFKQVPQELIDRYKATGNAFASWPVGSSSSVSSIGNGGGIGAYSVGGGGGGGGTTTQRPTTGGTGTPTTAGTGLIGGSTGWTGYTPENNYDSVHHEELVEDRIKNLSNPENELNQRVRTNVLQSANARGLANSSIAEGAAQSAILDNAYQIANADAATFSNTRWKNQAHQFAMETMGKQFDIWKQQLGETRANELQDKYMTAVQGAQDQFAKMFQSIQSSNLTADEKTAALAEAQTVRDNSLGMFNALYSNMPRWLSSWSTLAPTYS